MGLLAQTLRQVASFVPERKITVGAQIPTWEEGKPQNPRYWHNYYRYALEGYSRNEIVFACVEELATSAAEPRLVVVRKLGKGKTEQLLDHPILELAEHPNPFTSRFQLIAQLIMFRAIAGNAYLNKGRSAAGKVVELWPLRPDRVFIIPDRQKYIGKFEYRLEDQTYEVRPEDVIQTKTRNALDDYYGLPPLAVCAERVDTDTMMRAFTLGFFRNAAVPAGLLNITKQVTAAERQLIRDKFRGETGGPQNWHQMLVMDGNEAKYTPMGMPLGQSGIVLPELDEISEARIGMAFGVPLELIGARLGMVHGNRSTMRAAEAHCWDQTLVPLYAEVAADLTRGMKPEYDGTPDEFDYLEFDLSTVKALQEDDDAKHKRVRDDIQAGLISVQEGRRIIGHDPEFEDDALLILARGLEPMTAADAMLGAPREDVAAGGGPTAPRPPTQDPTTRQNGQNARNGHGKRPPTQEEMDALEEVAAGR